MGWRESLTREEPQGMISPPGQLIVFPTALETILSKEAILMFPEHNFLVSVTRKPLQDSAHRGTRHHKCVLPENIPQPYLAQDTSGVILTGPPHPGTHQELP